MDTLKILLKLFKMFGRSNPLFEYRVGHSFISIQAFDFDGHKVGTPLLITESNAVDLETITDRWIAKRFEK